MANVWLEVFPPEGNQIRAEEIVNPGPKNMPERDSPPVVYFLIMFTMNMLRRLVKETNRYATQFIRSEARALAQKRFSRVHAWKSVTLPEMKGFLAVVMNMGLVRKPTIEQYWRIRGSQSTSWFRKMFTRNRFQNILKFLHLVNNKATPSREHPNYNPASKFQPVIDHFNMRSDFLYRPRRELSVDESLVGTKSRSVMTQYIPSKKSKFGIKLWMLVESLTGFVIRIICYRGKTFDPVVRGRLQGADVVTRLLSESRLLNKCYHVYCDSFFTSLRLARELINYSTYLTGTLRRNTPMPTSIKNADLPNNETKFMRNGRLLCVAYKDNDKRPVRMISTFHAAQLGNTRIPKIVNRYNRFMGGVDLNDMMSTFYNDQRKSMKVWKKVFFNILHRFAINAYILYKQNTDRPVSRLRFMEEVIEDLSREHLGARRTFLPVGVNGLARGKQRDCSVCSKRGLGRRRRTCYSCARCRRAVHPLCVHRHRCVET